MRSEADLSIIISQLRATLGQNRTARGTDAYAAPLVGPVRDLTGEIREQLDALTAPLSEPRASLRPR